MSKFYRDKKSFFASVLKGSGLYLIAGATLLVLFGVAVILFPGTNPDPSVENTPSGTDSATTDTASDPGLSTDTSASGDLPDLPVNADPQEPAQVTFIAPVPESLSTDILGFSRTTPVFSETMGDWRIHQGMDYFTNGEIEVCAAADGTVDQVYESELMGVSVEVVHADGTRSLYQSLAPDPAVIEGQEVCRGDVIGKTGNTADCEALSGTHLHFALLKDGVYQDPALRISH